MPILDQSYRSKLVTRDETECTELLYDSRISWRDDADTKIGEFIYCASDRVQVAVKAA